MGRFEKLPERRPNEQPRPRPRGPFSAIGSRWAKLESAAQIGRLLDSVVDFDSSRWRPDPIGSRQISPTTRSSIFIISPPLLLRPVSAGPGQTIAICARRPVSDSRPTLAFCSPTKLTVDELAANCVQSPQQHQWRRRQDDLLDCDRPEVGAESQVCLSNVCR